jgi:hypothetical protein
VWSDLPVARRPPLWWELPLGLIVFLVCFRLDGVSFGDRQAVGARHAAQLLGVERALRLDVEPPLNAWLAAHGGLAVAANYIYVAGYVLTSVAVLVFLYLRRPASYRWGRRSCIVLNVAAVSCFALFPVAPPRLTPSLNIVDTVVRQHIWGSWGSSVGGAADEYGALPSLHFALALWVAVMLFIAGTSLTLRALGVANVVVTGYVILATGNHYLLDAAASVVVVALSMAATAPRRRPRRAWDRFYTAPLRRSVPHVAGVVVMAASDAELAVRRLRQEIARAGPRWRQRLQRSSWRWPPTWTTAGEPNWSWHIARLDPLAYDDSGPVRRLAARMATEPFPEDRPRWRAWVVPAANASGVAVIVVVDRALDWRGRIDATLRSTAILDDRFRLLDTLLDRLRAPRSATGLS